MGIHRFSRRYRDMLLAAAAGAVWHSHDHSTQVGAALGWLDPRGRMLEILTTGTNQFPFHIDPHLPAHQERPFRYAHMRHAEIWSAMRLHTVNERRLSENLPIIQPRETVMAVTHLPCPGCATWLCRHGFVNILAPAGWTSDEQLRRWRENFSGADPFATFAAHGGQILFHRARFALRPPAGLNVNPALRLPKPEP